MGEVEIGKLVPVDVRAAWPHEALAFTPWLADNLDELADVIEIPLELQGTEVHVGSFAADILATDASTGTGVLIENQLTGSDHKHLGQIMTYLAAWMYLRSCGSPLHSLSLTYRQLTSSMSTAMTDFRSSQSDFPRCESEIHR